MKFLRIVLALWLCLGLLPVGELVSAAQTEHQCAHGHKNCKCPDQCGRPAPKPEDSMEGMACHRAVQAASEEPVEGPCWRSCSSQDEADQSAPRAFYLSAGDLVAAPANCIESAADYQAERLTARSSLPPSPPPRNS